MLEDWKTGGFGIYIHWPFCQSKCPYCDFNSHVSLEIDQSRWSRAYIAEIDRYAQLLPDRVLTSVYLGGGTPSLMNPEVVHAIIERIRHHWPTINDYEITLEANPGSVEATRFRGYAEAGVNRVSMGLQALNDRDLKRLGRVHSVSEGLAAFEIARNTFDRVSFDLIYTRQDQTLAGWQSELKTALSYATDHFSLYQLTIENGTAFGERYRLGKLRGLPEDDQAFSMYQATNELCSDAGLLGYEVSNYAALGSESRHNLIYWRYGDYIGIGPGAHGRLTLPNGRFASEGWKNPGRWLSEVEAGNGDRVLNELTMQHQSEEFLMMGLRLSEGIDPARYERLSGKPLSRKTQHHLTEIGMIYERDGKVCVTNNGRMVLNAIIQEFLAD